MRFSFEKSMIFFRWCVSRCFCVSCVNFWILAGCQKSTISNYNLSYNSQFLGSAPAGVILEVCLASLGVFYQIFDFPCFCLYSGPWQAAIKCMSDSLCTWRTLHFLCAILPITAKCRCLSSVSSEQFYARLRFIVASTIVSAYLAHRTRQTKYIRQWISFAKTDDFLALVSNSDLHFRQV